MAKIEEAELFTILPQQPTGIARLAALAEHADEGHTDDVLALREKLNEALAKNAELVKKANELRAAQDIPQTTVSKGKKSAKSWHARRLSQKSIPATVDLNSLPKRDQGAEGHLRLQHPADAQLLESEEPVFPDTGGLPPLLIPQNPNQKPKDKPDAWNRVVSVTATNQGRFEIEL